MATARKELAETFSASVASVKSTNAPTVTFRNLPFELREDIYLLAAGDPRNKEIHVKFLLGRKGNDESGTLESQTVDLLNSLQNVSDDIFEDAIDCFTDRSFCWVLSSDSQPHKFLLRALRRHVPKEVLGRIKSVRLSRVTLTEFTHPASGNLTGHGYDSRSRLKPQPAYLGYLGARIGPDDATGFFRAVQGDIAYGFTLVPHIFSSLQRLDIELDVLECHVSHDIWCFHQLSNFAIPTFTAERDGTTMVDKILRLGHLRSADTMKLRILWKNYGFPARTWVLNNPRRG